MLSRACPVAVALLAVGCSARDLPDDPAPTPLSTGIPAAAPGAVGASFDAPAATAIGKPPSMKAPKHPHAPVPPVPPIPPGPFGGEGVDEGEGGGPPAAPPPPIHPKKPPKPKGLTL